MAFSTSVLSRPLNSAILPALSGVPAYLIVANTFSFASICLFGFKVIIRFVLVLQR
jgi:hypothetical protein